MKKAAFLMAFVVILGSLFAQLVRADTNIDNCTTLNTPGETYLLTADIIDSNVTPQCILISAADVILDCQNYKIDGFNYPSGQGIYGTGPSNVTLKNCFISDWSWDGLDIDDTNGLVIENVTINNSNSAGMIIYHCSNVVLRNNLINNSMGDIGLKMDGSNNSILLNNTIENSHYQGIYLTLNFPVASTNNSIINNTIKYNNQSGISADSVSPNNTFIGNIIINNTADTGSGFLAGLQLDSANNTAYFNIIQDNYRGIETCGDYDGNLVYNTLLNNSMENGYPSIFCGNLSNAWNTTRQSGTRIYSNGNEIGGNYWTNSTGNGYSDTCADANTDGFCDCPYDVITNTSCTPTEQGDCGDVCGNNTDYLPLSPLYEEPPCQPSWNCTAWSACVRGYQTRDCTDDNKCGDNRTKPAESQACLNGIPNATYNISSDCCPISTFYCTDNETLVQLWNTSQGVSWAVEDCEFGCDNVTSDCAPAPFEANLWTLVIIIVIIAAIAVLYRWSKK